MHIRFFAICLLVSVVKCHDIYKDCKDSANCIEKAIIKNIDEIESKEPIKILGDYLVLKRIESNLTSLENSDGLIDRCIKFLNEHELNIKIPAASSREFVEAETRSKKLKRFILPLLILLKLKAAIVIPAILALIALVAFKGLGHGLIALGISGAVALKTLLDGRKVTYEVVPQLVSPHWSRIGLEAQGYHTIPLQ